MLSDDDAAAAIAAIAAATGNELTVYDRLTD